MAEAKVESVMVEETTQDSLAAQGTSNVRAIVWTGLVLATLQSVCTVLVGLGGARLLLSVLSLAAATSVFAKMDALHIDSIRIPMMLFALVSAVLGLVVVAQARRLRHRPAAQWRRDAEREAKQQRQEFWQVLLSGLTLVLLTAEEWIHVVQRHHW
ncbi:MAG: hypothetical protein KGK08_08420 [Acidobacteriota bacterium]|nr:hypothetical protein [Acidobacteriota bacterium]